MPCGGRGRLQAPGGRLGHQLVQRQNPLLAAPCPLLFGRVQACLPVCSDQFPANRKLTRTAAHLCAGCFPVGATQLNVGHMPLAAKGEGQPGCGTAGGGGGGKHLGSLPCVWISRLPCRDHGLNSELEPCPALDIVEKQILEMEANLFADSKCGPLACWVYPEGEVFESKTEYLCEIGAEGRRAGPASSVPSSSFPAGPFLGTRPSPRAQGSPSPAAPFRRLSYRCRGQACCSLTLQNSLIVCRSIRAPMTYGLLLKGGTSRVKPCIHHALFSSCTCVPGPKQFLSTHGFLTWDLLSPCRRLCYNLPVLIQF